MKGSGTIDDPYIVTNQADLADLALDRYAVYSLAADIALEGEWFSFSFGGWLIGNGHSITGLTIYSDTNAGLFHWLYETAVVEDLAIETSAAGVVSTGTTSAVGILAGSARRSDDGERGARISRVVTRGFVDSAYMCGGMVGSIGPTAPSGAAAAPYFDECAAFATRKTVATSSQSFNAPFVGYAFSGKAGTMSCVTSRELFYKQAGAMSPKFDAVGGSTHNYVHGLPVSIAEAAIANPESYPGWDFERVWEIHDGFPRLRRKAVAVPNVSTVSGLVQIDGTPAARTVRAFSYDTAPHEADGVPVLAARTLGQAQSDPATGAYEISLLGGYPGDVFVVAFDDYGKPFTPGLALAPGERVHPSTPSGYVYECDAAGELPEEEPAWSTDTETSQLIGTASMIARPFYRPVVHGPIRPALAEIDDGPGQT